MLEFDLSTPWYDLATAHFIICGLIGIVSGVLLKDLAAHTCNTRLARKEEAVESLELLIDDMTAQRTAQFHLLAARNLTRTETMIENGCGIPPRLSAAA